MEGNASKDQQKALAQIRFMPSPCNRTRTDKSMTAVETLPDHRTTKVRTSREGVGKAANNPSRAKTLQATIIPSFPLRTPAPPAIEKAFRSCLAHTNALLLCRTNCAVLGECQRGWAVSHNLQSIALCQVQFELRSRLQWRPVLLAAPRVSAVCIVAVSCRVCMSGAAFRKIMRDGLWLEAQASQPAAHPMPVAAHTPPRLQLASGRRQLR